MPSNAVSGTGARKAQASFARYEGETPLVSAKTYTPVRWRHGFVRVLITGNMGYIGPVLARFLRQEDPTIEIIGYDSAFFGHLLTGAETMPEILIDRQYYGDIREFPAEILEGVDAVVHLAAISNDPMGNKFEEVTSEINQMASVRVAQLAAQAGVSRFVFASRCSMYGFAEGGARTEDDQTNP